MGHALARVGLPDLAVGHRSDRLDVGWQLLLEPAGVLVDRLRRPRTDTGPSRSRGQMLPRTIARRHEPPPAPQLPHPEPRGKARPKDEGHHEKDVAVACRVLRRGGVGIRRVDRAVDEVDRRKRSDVAARRRIELELEKRVDARSGRRDRAWVAGRARDRADRLGRLEDLPAITGEVDLRPGVRVRLADEERVGVRIGIGPFAGRESDRDARRQADRSRHHHHRAGVVLAESGPIAHRVEQEEVDEVLAASGTAAILL